MSTDDDRRAIDRFVAGLAVDADELATSITSQAVNRAVVNEALLEGLASDEAVVRRRTAQRVAHMREVAPRVAARLRVLAGSDDDVAVREASAAALRAHSESVPGEPGPAEAVQGRRPALVLLLRALATRSRDEAGIDLEPRYEEDAPGLDAELRVEAGRVRIVVRGLPHEFAGTRPVVRARRERDAPLEPLASADEPVSAEGGVTLTGSLGGESLDDVADWLHNGTDLIVPND